MKDLFGNNNDGFSGYGNNDQSDDNSTPNSNANNNASSQGNDANASNMGIYNSLANWNPDASNNSPEAGNANNAYNAADAKYYTYLNNKNNGNTNSNYNSNTNNINNAYSYGNNNANTVSNTPLMNDAKTYVPKNNTSNTKSNNSFVLILVIIFMIVFAGIMIGGPIMMRSISNDILSKMDDSLTANFNDVNNDADKYSYDSNSFTPVKQWPVGEADSQHLDFYDLLLYNTGETDDFNTSGILSIDNNPNGTLKPDASDSDKQKVLNTTIGNMQADASIFYNSVTNKLRFTSAITTKGLRTNDSIDAFIEKYGAYKADVHVMTAGDGTSDTSIPMECENAYDVIINDYKKNCIDTGYIKPTEKTINFYFSVIYDTSKNTGGVYFNSADRMKYNNCLNGSCKGSNDGNAYMVSLNVVSEPASRMILDGDEGKVSPDSDVFTTNQGTRDTGFISQMTSTRTVVVRK